MSKRLRRAQSIKTTMLNYKDHLLKAYRLNDLDAFKREAHSYQSIQEQLVDFAQDTDTASEGYVTVPKVRRALFAAARELEAMETAVSQWLTDAAQAETKEHMTALINQITGYALLMTRIQFSPSIPQARPTRDELMKEISDETSLGTEQAYARRSTDSTLNKEDGEQPGALGDAQLAHLKTLLGE